MNNIAEIKETYPVGTKVRLLYMDDCQAPPVGTCGTVTAVDDVGDIHVKWDNGSGLALIPEADKFEVIAHTHG